MTSIAKIVIEIDGQTIELSRQQAEELRSILDSVIGVKVTIEPAREKEYIPYPVPVLPSIYPRWDRWYVTVDNTTATFTATSG